MSFDDAPRSGGPLRPRLPALSWQRRFGLGLLLSLFVVGSAGTEEALPRPAPPPPATAGSGTAASAPISTASAARNGPVVLGGKVVEIFANRFILEATDGRVLVEPSSDQAALSASVGDNVRVEGQRSGVLIRAQRVFRGSESVLAAVSPSPIDRPAAALSSEQAGVAAILQELGITPIGPPVRKKQHTEILARMSDGRTVYVSLDRSNRLWEIEEAEHQKNSAVPRGLAREDYERLAREAGFSPAGSFEQKRHHIELGVTNRRGERLELHMDLAGTTYRQIWLW